MPDVLISINRPHTDNIRIGFKTLELRKSAPKKPPCRVYIYETQNRNGCGAVIGEFILNYVDWYQKRKNKDTITRKIIDSELLWEFARITYKEYCQYAAMHNNRYPNIYAWQIDNLKIYDTSKPLSEFGMSRPPQSWCYIKKSGG